MHFLAPGQSFGRVFERSRCPKLPGVLYRARQSRQLGHPKHFFFLSQLPARRVRFLCPTSKSSLSFVPAPRNHADFSRRVSRSAAGTRLPFAVLHPHPQSACAMDAARTPPPPPPPFVEAAASRVSRNWLVRGFAWAQSGWRCFPAGGFSPSPPPLLKMAWEEGNWLPDSPDPGVTGESSPRSAPAAAVSAALGVMLPAAPARFVRLHRQPRLLRASPRGLSLVWGGRFLAWTTTVTPAQHRCDPERSSATATTQRLR